MRFRYTEKKVTLPENVHKYAEKKVMKLERFFGTDADALVTFSVEKNRNNVEITVHAANTYFRASESTSDMFASIDAAVATIERLRSDLALSRNHEQQLETTLNNVTNSTFWKITWPMRYLVSKSRQIWHTFPLFVFFATLHEIGISGVMEQAKARREYGRLFPGKVMPADRFAAPELLVKQAGNQPDGPKISIVVPLYNTPQNFLEELLDSVQNQTYRNWELCMVDAGQDEKVAQIVKGRARTDDRIRYRKLDSNEGIAGNTNQGFALATGEYIALLDHDDILHPCALWYVAEAIAKQGADFVYTDEVTFEGDIDHLTVYHFKPDYMLDNLRSNNYAPSGFLNKKFVDPDIAKKASGLSDYHERPWPIIRLAELYLGYAECCVETGDLPTAREYIDKVRARAGIPSVEVAWANFSKDPSKANTQDGLREIVRNERMNEFYLENQNFWDMRRWLLAEKYFNVKAQGMNIEATTLSGFAKLSNIVFERKFTSPANYLMPIPTDDINKNTHIVQNPGY